MNPDAFSFPSGHACAGDDARRHSQLRQSALRIPALGLALLVGASRVYLRVHYVTDVVVGQLVGAVTASVVSLALL